MDTQVFPLTPFKKRVFGVRGKGYFVGRPVKVASSFGLLFIPKEDTSRGQSTKTRSPSRGSTSCPKKCGIWSRGNRQGHFSDRDANDEFS